MRHPIFVRRAPITGEYKRSAELDGPLVLPSVLRPYCALYCGRTPPFANFRAEPNSYCPSAVPYLTRTSLQSITGDLDRLLQKARYHPKTWKIALLLLPNDSLRELPGMMSAKFSDILTPSPLSTFGSDFCYRIHTTSLTASAFP